MIQPEISLCMIVRDEGERLERCLAAVREIVDEIIIVDTGSVDDTFSIAKNHGAEVISAEWTGDFAAARNISLAAATKPWILVLDADEIWVRSEESKVELERIVNAGSEGTWGYWMQVTSLLGSVGEERVTDAVCRLFRNDPRIVFQGRIHEEVATSIQLFAPDGIEATQLEIEHHGYLDDVIHRKNKTCRNMQLIRSALNGGEDQPELLYALSAEWFQQGNYDEALRLLHPLMARISPESGYHSDIVLKTAYALRESGYTERALAVVQAWRAHYNDFPDLLELGGVLELDQGYFSSALEWFRQARQSASAAGRYTSLSGAGTYRSFTLEGMAHEQMGEWSQAEEAYIAALELNPDCVQAWQRLLLLAAVTGHSGAINRAVVRVSLPPVAWQALISAALDAKRPEWLLRHAGLLATELQVQPLARGLLQAQLGEDDVAQARLEPWAVSQQHGPAAALVLWALSHKNAASSAALVRRRQRWAAASGAGLAAEALLREPARGPGAPPAAPQAVLAAVQALAGVGAWGAWQRLLAALPSGAAPALLAALPPAARCGLLRAPAGVRAELPALCGAPPELPTGPDAVPAMVLAGTLALLAGRRQLAREWAECAHSAARQAAQASSRPARDIPPGVHRLLRLTSPDSAGEPTYSSACKLLFIYL